MSLADEIDEVLELCKREVRRGDPMRFAAGMIQVLEQWKGILASGRYDEQERRGDRGAVFRVLSDDGILLEHPISQRILELADKYVHNRT